MPEIEVNIEAGSIQIGTDIDVETICVELGRQGPPGPAGPGSTLRVMPLIFVSAFHWQIPEMPTNATAIFDGPIQFAGINYTISGQNVTVIDGNEFQNPSAIYTI